MGSNTFTRSRPDTVRVHAEARALLSRLVLERDRSERRRAEAGQPDPMKFITGRSALDNAVERTCEMVRRVEELLAQRRWGRGSSVAPARAVPAEVRCGAP